MNTTFSLSKQKEKVFPDYIQYDGNTFFINADFRNILRIMRMYDDDSILQIQKPYLLLKWFFRDEIDEVTGIDLFKQFMGTADENDSQSEQQFDFEIDASQIADTTATMMLGEIQKVIKDEKYSDFEAVEEIVCIFEKYKIDFGSRHDF